MKTPLILLTSLTLSMTSFTNNVAAANPTAELIAKQVVTALQHNSAKEFSTLFPTLADFHHLMQENSLLYGDYLPEAKEEFAKEFERKLAPAFKNSFEQVISAGNKKGIDWNDVEFTNVQVNDLKQDSPITISFSSNGKSYQLIIEKTLTVNGQWKLSQFMKLV